MLKNSNDENPSHGRTKARASGSHKTCVPASPITSAAKPTWCWCEEAVRGVSLPYEDRVLRSDMFFLHADYYFLQKTCWSTYVRCDTTGSLQWSWCSSNTIMNTWLFCPLISLGLAFAEFNRGIPPCSIDSREQVLPSNPSSGAPTIRTSSKHTPPISSPAAIAFQPWQGGHLNTAAHQVLAMVNRFFGRRRGDHRKEGQGNKTRLMPV